MKPKLLFFLQILLCNSLVVGIALSGIPPYELTSPFAFSKFGTGTWGSGGTTSVRHDDAAEAFYNPALLNPGNFSLYLQLSNRTTTKYIADISYGGQLLLPDFVLASASYDNFGFGIGYAKLYDQQMDFGKIPVTTEEFPDGTGDYYSPKYRDEIKSYFILSSYKVADEISIGIGVRLNYASNKAGLNSQVWQGKDQSSTIFGGIYVQPINFFSIGFSVERSTNIVYTMSQSSPPASGVTPSGRNDAYTIVISPMTASAVIPLISRLGIQYNVVDDLSLSAEIDVTDWSQQDNSKKSVLDFHLGGELTALPTLRLSAGLFTQNDKNSSSYYNLSQRFLTTGISWNAVWNITLSGTAIKSVLTNYKGFNQDGFLFSIGYHL
jgi:long-subunit fatty acid transport protein